jgi:hypothetical protein
LITSPSPDDLAQTERVNLDPAARIPIDAQEATWSAGAIDRS